MAEEQPPANAPAADTPLMAELRPFHFEGKSLADDMDAEYTLEEDDLNEEEGAFAVRYALKKLLDCKYTEVHEILSENKTVVRPLEYKVYWTKAGEVTSALKWDRRDNFVGLARYLFLPAINKTMCTKCEKHTNYGPFEECVVVGTELSQRACTSCFYKGESTSCSLRKAYEKRLAKENDEEVPFSAETIRGCKLKDLERVLAWVRAEIAKRKAAMQ